MILAIDAGNTHITFGCIDAEGQVLYHLSIATDEKETAVGFAAKIKTAFDLFHVDLSEMRGAILSSVVPAVTGQVSSAVEILIGKRPMILGAGVKTGLHLSVDDPGTIASDLVAMAVAAKEEYPLPCAIVYMGTALALTVVDEKGRFIGGAFLPGAQISLDALTKQAALLPDVELLPPKKSIGSSTSECMRSGIVYGIAGAVDGVLERFSKELETDFVSVVSTGNAGKQILDFCRHPISHDENLLLKGLGIIYKKNSK